MKLEVVKYVLYVQDMPRAIRFYRELFGLEPRLESDHWSELTFGNAIVALHGGGEGGEVVTGLSFQMDDVRAACAAAAELGGRIVHPPEQRSGEPILLGTVADPDGNRVMVTQWVG